MSDIGILWETKENNVRLWILPRGKVIRLQQPYIMIEEAVLPSEEAGPHRRSYLRRRNTPLSLHYSGPVI